MALSMFLRPSVCTTRVFSQQLMRLVSQPALAQRSLRMLPATTMAMKHLQTTSSTTPIINAVRKFQTSVARLSGEKPQDHARLWVIERITSAVLVVLIPLALMMPNKIFDSALAILVTAHSFWGLEAIAVDYARPIVVGPIIPKIALGLVYLVSIATLGGLFYLITHDIGLGNAIRQFWAIKSEQKA